MKVSLLLPIHNRSRLFSMGLETLAAQEFDPHEWEIIVLDDMSTENLKLVFEPYIGRLNIRHVRIDHTRHHIFKELNPNWKADQPDPPKWWHTPALALNIGIKKARGEVLWITQPEVLQEQHNLARGYEIAAPGTYFGFVDVFNDVHGRVKAAILEGRYSHTDPVRRLIADFKNYMRRESPAMYWYSAFCQRKLAHDINGVREIYLRGAAAEDDDFRERLHLASCVAILMDGCHGLHLYHEDEKEFHHRRDHDQWNEGLAHNRHWYGMWRMRGDKKARAVEQDGNWGDLGCVEWEKEYPL